MLFLIGNKSDLTDRREVSRESILEFKDLNNILYCQETSASSGKNIDVLFSDAARLIYHKYKDRMDEVGNGAQGDLTEDHGDDEDNGGR